MAPVILSVLLLGTMVSLQTFEVEQVLGTPFRFFVFSTTIYDLLVTRVPRYDAATALAVLVLVAMLPLIWAQQWVTRGRRYTTVTGQFRNQPHALGAWRWPALAFALVVVAIVLGVPVVFALLGTFMKLFGFFHVAEPWTLDNWRTVLTDELFLHSLRNTVVLAVGHRGGRGPAALADRLHRGAHALRGPARARLRLVAAVHGAGRHPRPGPPVAVPGHAAAAAALRDHGAADHRRAHLRHAARRADHQERPHAAGGRARGGLPHRRAPAGGPPTGGSCCA